MFETGLFGVLDWFSWLVESSPTLLDFFSQLNQFFPQLGGFSATDFYFIIFVLVLVLIIIFVGVFFFLKRRTPVEKHAAYIARLALDIKNKKSIDKKDASYSVVSKSKVLLGGLDVSSSKKDSKIELVSKKVDSEKKDVSIKSMLIKKFQSKIASQLGSGVVVSDVSSSGADFVVHAEVAGVKLLLTLDPAGKIIDYKKVK